MILSPTRIICIGNRYAERDAAGPAVYDRLVGRRLPPGVDVIDGGLAGLNLIRYVEGAKRVVFVDAADGFTGSKRVIVLGIEDVVSSSDATFGHAAGLAYLLRVLPDVIDGEMPAVEVIGITGHPDDALIEEATRKCLQMTAIRHGIDRREGRDLMEARG